MIIFTKIQKTNINKKHTKIRQQISIKNNLINNNMTKLIGKKIVIINHKKYFN